MLYFYIASMIVVAFAFSYLLWYVIKSFLAAYKKYENIDNKFKRFFIALGVALLKGIAANNATPVD